MALDGVVESELIAMPIERAFYQRQDARKQLFRDSLRRDAPDSCVGAFPYVTQIKD